MPTAVVTAGNRGLNLATRLRTGMTVKRRGPSTSGGTEWPVKINSLDFTENLLEDTGLRRPPLDLDDAIHQ